jgi:hypothetical protein
VSGRIRIRPFGDGVDQAGGSEDHSSAMLVGQVGQFYR